MGGGVSSLSIRKAPGSRTATTPAFVMAAIPASSAYSMWSADSAPYRAASAAPPPFDNWSACSLTGRPSARALSNSRATSSVEKAMGSQ